MGIILGFFKALKLPVKLLKGWLREKRKRTINEKERKLREYVRNFSPSKIKNRSWQKYDKKGKRKKKYKKIKRGRKFSAKSNNSSV